MCPKQRNNHLDWCRLTAFKYMFWFKPKIWFIVWGSKMSHSNSLPAWKHTITQYHHLLRDENEIKYFSVGYPIWLNEKLPNFSILSGREKHDWDKIEYKSSKFSQNRLSLIISSVDYVCTPMILLYPVKLWSIAGKQMFDQIYDTE